MALVRSLRALAPLALLTPFTSIAGCAAASPTIVVAALAGPPAEESEVAKKIKEAMGGKQDAPTEPAPEPAAEPTPEPDPNDAVLSDEAKLKKTGDHAIELSAGEGELVLQRDEPPATDRWLRPQITETHVGVDETSFLTVVLPTSDIPVKGKVSSDEKGADLYGDHYKHITRSRRWVFQADTRMKQVRLQVAAFGRIRPAKSRVLEREYIDCERRQTFEDPDGRGRTPWCGSLGVYTTVLRRANLTVEIDVTAGPGHQSADLWKLTDSVQARLDALPTAEVTIPAYPTLEGRGAMALRDADFPGTMALAAIESPHTSAREHGMQREDVLVFSTLDSEGSLDTFRQTIYVARDIADAKAQLAAFATSAETDASINADPFEMSVGSNGATYRQDVEQGGKVVRSATVYLFRAGHIVMGLTAIPAKGRSFSPEDMRPLAKIVDERVHAVLNDSVDGPSPTSCVDARTCLLPAGELPRLDERVDLRASALKGIHEPASTRGMASVVGWHARLNAPESNNGAVRGVKQTIWSFPDPLTAVTFMSEVHDPTGNADFKSTGSEQGRVWMVSGWKARKSVRHLVRDGAVVMRLDFDLDLGSGYGGAEKEAETITRSAIAHLIANRDAPPGTGTDPDDPDAPDPDPGLDEPRPGSRYIPALHVRGFFEFLSPTGPASAIGGGAMLGARMNLIPGKRVSLPLFVGGRIGANAQSAILGDGHGGLGFGFGFWKIGLNVKGGGGYDVIAQNDAAFFGLPGAPYWFAGGDTSIGFGRVGLYGDFRYLGRILGNAGGTVPAEFRVDTGFNIGAGPGSLTLGFLYTAYAGTAKSFGGAIGYSFVPRRRR